MMKLSNATVGVLKNFAEINQNILIEEGKQIRTMSTMKNILASAGVSEEFPKNVGIYDLNEFLGVLSMAKDADITFEENQLVMKSGRTKITYMYSDTSILTLPPETFNEPEIDLNFNIDKELLQNILKASAVMQLPDVVMHNGKVTVTDLKNTTSNNFSVELPEDVAENGTWRMFRCHFKAENLKMLPGDYAVRVATAANVSQWVGEEASYWIAMEATND
jgi:hypothetical protein